jgi:predicted nucleotidyltransferase
VRIKEQEIAIIKDAAHQYFGDEAVVYLFGSRVDDNKKGGDIDLYIETRMKKNLFEQKIRMLRALYKYLGEQKIDIVINNFNCDKYIYHVAKSEGTRL